MAQKLRQRARAPTNLRCWVAMQLHIIRNCRNPSLRNAKKFNCKMKNSGSHKFTTVISNAHRQGHSQLGPGADGLESLEETRGEEPHKKVEPLCGSKMGCEGCMRRGRPTGGTTRHPSIAAPCVLRSQARTCPLSTSGAAEEEKSVNKGSRFNRLTRHALARSDAFKLSMSQLQSTVSAVLVPDPTRPPIEITLMPYTPEWARDFQRERQRLIDAGCVADLVHVGSTSIPGATCHSILAAQHKHMPHTSALIP
jgi:hypothetical protein